jgi:hypothetical protein
VAISLRLGRDTIELIRHLERELGKTRFAKALLLFFNRQALLVAGRISKRFLSGQRVKRRTGSLARSITGSGVLVKGVPGMRVGVFRGPALQYAGVQEYGTRGKSPESPYPTIVPKKAKALAVPVNPGGSSLTFAGVPRYTGPRQFPGKLRFVPFRRGMAIGALYPEAALKNAPKSPDGKLTLPRGKAAYLLLRKVDLPARHYLRDGFRQYLPELAESLARYIRDLVVLRGRLRGGTT